MTDRERRNPVPEPGSEDSGTDPVLEARLRALPALPARPQFRDRLRAQFREGSIPESRESASRREGDARTAEPVDSRDQSPLLEAAIRRTPLAPAPRVEFRERLRAGFANGTLEERVPRASGTSRRLRLLSPLAGVFLTGLAAAAAVVLFLLLRPAEEEWRVLIAEGDSVTLDGEQVRVGEELLLAERIFEAEIVETSPTTRLHLALGDRARLELRPGTRVRAREFAELAGSEPRSLVVESGEVYLWKDPDAGGPDLLVQTETTEVAVTGTTLGVYCWAGGTCTCVAKGHVNVSCCAASPSGGAVDTLHSHVTLDGGRPCEHIAFPEEDQGCESSGHHYCRLVEFANFTE